MGYHSRVRHGASAILLTAALCWCSRAAAQDGSRVSGQFLGWAGDSDEFGYALASERKGTHFFVKRTSPSGVAQPIRVSSVLRRSKRRGYEKLPLKGQRLSPFVQAFMVGPGRTLRVVLELHHHKMGYRMVLDDAAHPGEAKTLLRGVFREVWTDVSARAWRSKNGRWVAVMLDLSTPYDGRTWVEGVFVGQGRAP